jgi:hypothetical protein
MTFTLTAPSACYRVNFSPVNRDNSVVVRAESFNQEDWAWQKDYTHQHSASSARNLYRSLIAQNYCSEA